MIYGIFANILIAVSLFMSTIALASGQWSDHQSDINRIETSIYKFEQELDVMIERKKTTRDRARIEETLQRIVEIHSELITLRGELDTMREHFKEAHPAQLGIFRSTKKNAGAMADIKRRGTSPLDKKLDDLMIKIQLKFANFLEPEVKKVEMVEVEKVVKIKQRKKKEKEADIYLRRKSKVRLAR